MPEPTIVAALIAVLGAVAMGLSKFLYDHAKQHEDWGFIGGAALTGIIMCAFFITVLASTAFPPTPRDSPELRELRELLTP